MKTINNLPSVGVQDCEVISWGELCARKLPAGKCFEVQCLGWMWQQFLHVGRNFLRLVTQMHERIEKTDVPHHGTSIKQPPCPKLRLTILKRSGNFFCHIMADLCLWLPALPWGRAMLFQAAGCKGQHHRALRGWTALVAILWRCKRQELCRSRGFSARFWLARGQAEKTQVVGWHMTSTMVSIQGLPSKSNDWTIWRSSWSFFKFGTFGASLCQTLGGPKAFGDWKGPFGFYGRWFPLYTQIFEYDLHQPGVSKKKIWKHWM